MTKVVSLILLKIVARNVQSILDFIKSFDAALDAYIAQEEARIGGIDLQIADLQDDKMARQKDVAVASSLKRTTPFVASAEA